jgi:hyperosmotically inducible protein
MSPNLKIVRFAAVLAVLLVIPAPAEPPPADRPATPVPGQPTTPLPERTAPPTTNPSHIRDRDLRRSAGVLSRSADIVGLEVRNYQREKLGKVTDLLFDLPGGRLVAVVVSSGGVLGVGDRHIAVDPAAFHYDEAEKVLHLEATKEALQNAPQYDVARWEELRHQPDTIVGYRGDRVFTSEPSRESVKDTDVTREPAKPDNSAVNERDRKGTEPTPLDQGNSKSDTEITAKIRKAVMARDGLSVSAQNVKIITSKGHVTLRGPVNSDDERRIVEELAVAATSQGSVDNQLEVKKP